MTASSSSPRTVRALVACAAVLGAAAMAGCSSPSSSPEAGGAADTAAPAGAAVREPLPPAEFAAFISENPDVPLINVHIPYEGHIDGTDAFVPVDEIGTWEGLPADRDAPIALYCRSGSMSAQATATLVDLGYTNLVDLDGGMNAWTAAGNTLQTNG